MKRWKWKSPFSDKEYVFEVGKYAPRANGAVGVRQGNTFLLATVVARKEPIPLDFVPLGVEYRERYSAAGRIPRNRARREGKITDEEILLSRLVDRSLRPLFPSRYRFETQVLIHPFSLDESSDLATLALLASSLALHISDLPWEGPVVGTRLLWDGKNWHFEKEAKEIPEEVMLDFFFSFSPTGLVMVEGEGKEVEESLVFKAFEQGEKFSTHLFPLFEEIRKAVGKEKWELPSFSCELLPKVKKALEERWEELLALSREKRELLLGEISKELSEEGQEVSFLVRECYRQKVKEHILATGKRLDGRSFSEIRPVEMEIGLLPSAHGSALFCRGETQALASCTLGLPSEMELKERPLGAERSFFLLHYNFPAYSVGEIGRRSSPARREIGHGHLARRAFLPVLPELFDFPYTIRVTSDITSSDGSTSMATVCAASLAMMDGGVPLKRLVAGIALGLLHTEDQWVILTDISGEEDQWGDMDFKIAGTEKGITALQMDNKLGAISQEIFEKALLEGKKAREFLLEKMVQVSRPKEVSRRAPRVALLKITLPWEEFLPKLVFSGGEAYLTFEAKKIPCELIYPDEISGKKVRWDLFQYPYLFLEVLEEERELSLRLWETFSHFQLRREERKNP